MSLGIDNLKKAGKFGVGLGMQIEKALADGKFTWTDLPGFVDELLEIPGIVNNREAIVAEFKDLTIDERAELLAYLKQEFDLADDVLESKIEKGLDIAFALLSFLVKPASDEPKAEGDDSVPGSNTEEEEGG